MKNQKIYVLLFSITLLFLASIGFKQKLSCSAKNEVTDFNQLNECSEYNNLRKAWPALKEENIKRIIFHETGNQNFEVPQECLQGTIELLDKAMNEPKHTYDPYYMNPNGLIIITDKGKYVFPLSGWETAYPRYVNGLDWYSSELVEYLTQCRLDVFGLSELGKRVDYDYNEYSYIRNLAKYRQQKATEITDYNQWPKYKQQYWQWLSNYDTPFYHNALTKDLKGKEIQAVVFTIGYMTPIDPNLEKCRVGIIGDPNVVAEILGKPLNYEVVFRNALNVIEVTNAFIEAGEEDKNGELISLYAPRFVFLTREKAYVIRYDISSFKRSEGEVTGVDFKSKKLKENLVMQSIFETIHIFNTMNFSAPPSSFLQKYYKKVEEKER